MAAVAAVAAAAAEAALISLLVIGLPRLRAALRAGLRRLRHATAGRRWAKALGLASAALPACEAAALVGPDSEGGADLIQILSALTRTAAVCWWAFRSAARYKAMEARHAAAGSLGSEEHARELSEAHRREARRLLEMAQYRGGIYIKACQLAVSVQAAALPPEYREVLASLQDRVPPRSFDRIRRALVRELGRPLEDVFSEFNPDAHAAASLAQVHKARLLDGTNVAVKVQYPRLEFAVAADLATMITLSRLAAFLFPRSDFRWLFQQLQRKLLYELDFRHEAQNSQRFAALMRSRKDVAVPRVYAHLSGRRLIVMDWADGVRVSDAEGLAAVGLAPREVAVLLLDVFAESQFCAGYIHGDPHPGNILVRVRPERRNWLARVLLGSRPRPQLVLLDHGHYVELPEDLRRNYCQLWAAILLGDQKTAREAAAALGGEQAARILPELLRPRDWGPAVTREDRRRMAAEVGIGNFADLSRVLSEAPQALLDCLQLSTVVRGTATQLGATIPDRLRVHAAHAVRGMTQGALPPAKLHYVGSLGSRIRRWRLFATVFLMRMAAALGGWVQGEHVVA